LFIFRIDTDYASKEAIEKLYSICEWNSIPATWFIDVKSQEKYLDVFKLISNHETALHCYEHRTYPDVESNMSNILKAQEILMKAGIKAAGFAAPFGTWNQGIRDAIVQAGFEYSSEFSYDYDNLPSFPLKENEVSGALQVPVHPVSIGSLKRQGFTRDEMIAYFRSVIAQKEAVHDPMFIYHHPNDGNGEVITSLFEYALERKMRAVTMLEYARWWKQRNECSVLAEYDKGNILFSSAAAIPDLKVRLTNADGKETFIQPAGSVLESALEWKNKPTPVPLPDDIERVTKFNPWVPLIRFEDIVHKII